VGNAVYDRPVSDSPPTDFELHEAFEPFSKDEAGRLRHYIELCEKLRGSRFFDQYVQRFEIKASSDSISFELPYDDDEAVTTMVARLRKLHLEERPGAASFPRTVRLLRQHTQGRNNPSVDWIRKLLDHYEQQVDLATQAVVIGLSREVTDAQGNTISEPVTPDENLWDWVYGELLHDDADRRARLKAWAPIEAHRFNFLKIASDLAKVYYSFSGIVREVLEESVLMPQS
jgi:hypothetical protein